MFWNHRVVHFGWPCVYIGSRLSFFLCSVLYRYLSWFGKEVSGLGYTRWLVWRLIGVSSRWIRLPAVVFASIVGYSFLFIVAEYTFGSYKNPAPWIFMSAYLPFFILPVSSRRKGQD
jgi:hypothetical protein